MTKLCILKTFAKRASLNLINLQTTHKVTNILEISVKYSCKVELPFKYALDCNISVISALTVGLTL